MAVNRKFGKRGINTRTERQGGGGAEGRSIQKAERPRDCVLKRKNKTWRIATQTSDHVERQKQNKQKVGTEETTRI